MIFKMGTLTVFEHTNISNHYLQVATLTRPSSQHKGWWTCPFKSLSAIWRSTTAAQWTLVLRVAHSYPLKHDLLTTVARSTMLAMELSWQRKHDSWATRDFRSELWGQRSTIWQPQYQLGRPSHRNQVSLLMTPK